MRKWLITGSALAIIVISVVILIGYFRHRVKTELNQNHQRLLEEKYNVTLAFRYFSKLKNKMTSLEFLIPEGDAKSVSIDVWNRALIGNIHIKIVTSTQDISFESSGKNIEDKKEILLNGGEYQLIVDFTRAVFGALNLGLKGNITWVRSLEETRCAKVTPGPEDEFHWPYLLFEPEVINKNRLLVIPNNTGFASDIERIHEEKAKNEILRGRELAEQLGVPLLVPIFPRPKADWKVYTHALDRDTLLIDRIELRRLDLQLIEMIKNTKERLKNKGINIDDKIFLFGFSASGMFVNRFTILHPDWVQAVACGSPGGWPLAPVSEFKGKRLRYPVGIFDISVLTGSEVNKEQIKGIPMYFFLGEEDDNDSVLFRDGYDKEDEILINDLFGTSLQQRFRIATQLYKEAGLNAKFVFYSGVGHMISPEMQEDVIKFFLKN